MRILLAEDNEHLNYILTLQLQNDGFTVDSCMDGEEAFYYMEQQVYDVILLDRMLPHLSGTDILQKARAQQIHTPIILITALSSLEDKINGLDYGADDYLVKPFEYDELAARIRCVCRRPSKLNIVEEQTIADITWNEIENKLSGSLGSTFLSKREAALFQFFFLNYQHTIPRASILSRVWGIESEVEDGNIDNYIHFLRKKLKEVGSCLKIVTIRGVGYRLE